MNYIQAEPLERRLLKGDPGGLSLRSDHGYHSLCADPLSGSLLTGHLIPPIPRRKTVKPPIRTGGSSQAIRRGHKATEPWATAVRPGRTTTHSPALHRKPREQGCGGAGSAECPQTSASARGRETGNGLKAQKRAGERASETNDDGKAVRPDQGGTGQGHTAKCGGKGRKRGPCPGFPPTH